LFWKSPGNPIVFNIPGDFITLASFGHFATVSDNGVDDQRFQICEMRTRVIETASAMPNATTTQAPQSGWMQHWLKKVAYLFPATILQGSLVTMVTPSDDVTGLRQRLFQYKSANATDRHDASCGLG
jgi:hypothetical protein